MRFQIKLITSANAASVDDLDSGVLASTGIEYIADLIAEKLASSYYYGVAIVDTEERTINWGDRVTDEQGVSVND